MSLETWKISIFYNFVGTILANECWNYRSNHFERIDFSLVTLKCKMLPTSWQHSFFSTDRSQQIKIKGIWKKLNILTGIQQFFNFINMLEVMKVHLPNAKMEGTYFNQP